MMADLDEQLAVGESLLARNLGWIAAADAKASTIFGIDAAMLGVLAALTPTVSGDWQILPAIASFIAAVALLASVTYLALATFPRLDGPKNSIVFFGTAVSLTSQEFTRRVQQGITDELVQDVAAQAFRNAEIARVKYHHLKSSQMLMFLGAALWLGAISLLYYARSAS